MQSTTIVVVLTLVISAIAALIPITVYLMESWERRRDRKRKQITTEIISNVSAVHINEEVKNKVQVTFNSHPVSDIRLIYLKMTNTGSEAIGYGDYVSNTQIKFDFGNNTEVLETEVAETVPDSIKAEINIHTSPSSGTIMLDPLVLNEQESVMLRILLSGFKNEIRNETRLKDVKQIMTAKIPMLVSIKNFAITSIFLMVISPFLFLSISAFLYSNVFYLIGAPSAPRSTTNFVKFYNGDFLGSIITTMIIIISYCIINYLIPTYIHVSKQKIIINNMKRYYTKFFAVTSCVFLFICTLIYGAIAISIGRYIGRTFDYYDSMTSSTNDALNISDLVTSIITAIILIIICFFLNKFFPLKKPIEQT